MRFAPVIESAGVELVGEVRRPGDGGLITLEDMGVRIAALPFVSRRGIVKAEHLMDTDPDQHAARYEDRMRRLIELLTEDMDSETVNVVATHTSVHGAEVGGGEHIFDYAVPSSVFPSYLSYVALGHYHRQQQIPGAGSNLVCGFAASTRFRRGR